MPVTHAGRLPQRQRLQSPRQARCAHQQGTRISKPISVAYRIVFMQPKFAVTTIAAYDETILKQVKGSGGDARPTSSVVRTISE